MAPPDFNKSTKDLLRSRAAGRCSNPDCDILTIGPNTTSGKTTSIGQAAHIFAARKGAARFNPSMSDIARAGSSNGIWLCTACHTKIDADERLYPSELLFKWRYLHEDKILNELGTRGDRIRTDLQRAQHGFMDKYPDHIRRIVLDRPDGWEWMFAAALLRHLSEPQFMRLANLRSGEYFIPTESITQETFPNWIMHRVYIMRSLTAPVTKLLERLTADFHEEDGATAAIRIHHTCTLICAMLSNMVDHEEQLKFAHLPDECDGLRQTLVDAIGANADKLKSIPAFLDETLSLLSTDHGGTVDTPRTINYTITFDLPDEFNKRFDREVSMLEQLWS